MMNEPVQLAQSVYNTYVQRGGKLHDDMVQAARYGVAYSGPDAFILGWPTARAMLVDGLPRRVEREKADCWFILIASGRGALKKIGALLPFDLPFIAYHRRKKFLKIWELARMRRYVDGK
jgi:hypothetical protein